MKHSDIIREFEKAGTLSKKEIHLLSNLLADLAHCKQGIKQLFDCYQEHIGVTKGLVQYLNMHSGTLEALSERLAKQKEGQEPVNSEPLNVEETLLPYGEAINE